MSCIPNSVTCPITHVTHQIVHKGKNEEEFSLYLFDLLERLNSSKIFLSISCAGWSLGVKKKSLGLLQMAECFENDFYEKKNGKISINLKPGFIVRTPINEEIINLISQVFSHENIILVMFDFVSEVTSMQEIGIKLNIPNIIDTQVTYPCDGRKYFTDTVGIGLVNCCNSATDCVEFPEVKECLEKRKATDYNYIYCNTIEDDDPFSHMLDIDFLKNSVLNIPLTAVAFVAQLQKYDFSKIKEASMAKVSAFMDIQKEHGLFRPSLMRQFAFIQKYFLCPKILRKKKAYDIIAKSNIIFENYDEYKKIIPPAQQISKTAINESIEKALMFLDNCSGKEYPEIPLNPRKK